MGRLWLAEIVTPSACAITPGSSSGIAHSVVWKYYWKPLKKEKVECMPSHQSS